MNIQTPVEFYSDPFFKVFKVPKWRSYFYKFLSVNVWGNFPSHLQRKISAYYCRLYVHKYSKYLIDPYIRINYTDSNYLEKFNPPKGKPNFETFQDFFTRQFKALPQNPSETVWPCEGLLCEMGKISNMKTVNVKGDIRNVETVFGLYSGDIPKEYNFTNVFLHNKNYHRIHAPTSGKITRIQHIAGDLIVLRPWIYVQEPSLPAFRNERYNLDLEDDKGRTWHISIVGGPAVGTVKLAENIQVGTRIKKLDELGVFYLGSTCCMASPVPPRFHTTDCFVEVASTY